MRYLSESPSAIINNSTFGVNGLLSNFSSGDSEQISNDETKTSKHLPIIGADKIRKNQYTKEN